MAQTKAQKAEYDREYRKKNAAHIREYYKQNAEKRRQNSITWRINNPEYNTIYSRARRESIPEIVKRQKREAYHKSPEKYREYSRQKRAKNPEIYASMSKKYRRTLKGRYFACKSGAKKRNLIFELTLPQYVILIEGKNCSYCDLSLPPTGGGLDRINNSQGYTLSNVTPCCDLCNSIFSNFDKEAIFIHLGRILAKRVLK